jgi:hypothetical protein
MEARKKSFVVPSNLEIFFFWLLCMFCPSSFSVLCASISIQQLKYNIATHYPREIFFHCVPHPSL